MILAFRSVAERKGKCKYIAIISPSASLNASFSFSRRDVSLHERKGYHSGFWQDAGDALGDYAPVINPCRL